MKKENTRLNLPGVKKDIPLKNHTTFKIGGPARYFLEVKTKEELVRAVKKAREAGLPFFILGGGSNILVSEKGFEGLVIKIHNSELKAQNADASLVYVGPGVRMAELTRFCLQENLAGFEWAAGIPGTVGGAIRGNAAAFGGAMSDVVKSVEVLDAEDLKTKTLDNQGCQFAYKESIFKLKKNLIILSSLLQLKKGEKGEIKKRVKEYLDYRASNHPLSFPSAGCVFKNPSPAQILKKFGRARSLSAGVLIDKCGLKGKRAGQAQISEKHANFIINLGEAKAEDVIELIDLAKKKVKEKFNIELEEEIQYLGF